ncbi:MAG: AsmA family protein [Gammaproteobacteria bacterium]|nr:AsmA family protein [Gammaproteobacteria bacterium]
MLILLKWLAGVALTLSLLLLVAVLAAPKLVDEQALKATLTKLVAEQTGREVQLDGALRLSVLPWLGLEIEQLTISQPPGFGEEMPPLLRVADAQLRVKPLPLLSRRVEMDTIVLRQPELNLITLADGQNSLDGLLGTQEKEAPADVEGSGIIAALLIQGVEIERASAVWIDQTTGADYRLQDLSLSAGDILQSEPAPLKLSGVAINASDPVPMEFKLNSVAALDIDASALTLRELNLNLKQAGQELALQAGIFVIRPGAVSDAERLVVRARFEKPYGGATALVMDNNFDKLRFDSAATLLLITQLQSQIKVEGEAAISATISTPNLELDIASQQAAAPQLNVKTELKSRPVELLANQLQVDFKAAQVTASQASIRSDDLRVTADKPVVSRFFGDPVLQTKLETGTFDLARLLKTLQIDYQAEDNTALRQVSFSGRVNVSALRAQLQDMIVKLDDSTLRGSLALDDGQPAAAQFNLALDSINIDRYLPRGAEQFSGNASTAATAPAVNGADALAVPMALFKSIQANGNFKANTLRSGGLRMDDVDVQVVSQGGAVTITPRAKLYEGSLGGTMSYAERAGSAELRIKNEIDLVSLAPFLKDADVTDQLSGIGSLVLDLTITEKDGKQTNRGTIKVKANNGIVRGIDIKNIVEQGYSRYRSLRGKPPETQQGISKANDETRFAELLGNFDIQDFKLRSREFSIKAPLFRISGDGEIDIARQSLDYLLQVSVVKSTSGQGGEALEELKGFTLPVRLSGALQSPRYALDMQALVKGMLAREVEQKKAELLEKKLGIEGGGSLSTGEILQQVIKRKIERKLEPKSKQGANPPVTQSSGKPGDSEVITIEPNSSTTSDSQSKESTSEDTSKSQGKSDAVPDVMAVPQQQQEASQKSKDSAEPGVEPEKDQEETLKERLLKEIFN